MAFLLDEQDRPTSRLVLPGAGGLPAHSLLLEVDPTAVRAPGVDAWRAPPAPSAATVAAALTTGAELDAATREFLDLVGNRNGRFDLGDASLWLERNP